MITIESDVSRKHALLSLEKFCPNMQPVEKPACVRLIENVQMQGFRNPEE
jgi:hypothetical protein